MNPQWTVIKLSKHHESCPFLWFNDLGTKGKGSEKFDGLIITGAPVEQMEFQDVAYWNELKEIMEWSKSNVYWTLHICWGAQAGLYYHYGVPKYPLENKMFGVFAHRVLKENVELTRGLDDTFFAPHSRHTEIKSKDVEKVKELEILSESDDAGVFIVSTSDNIGTAPPRQS